MKAKNVFCDENDVDAENRLSDWKAISIGESRRRRRRRRCRRRRHRRRSMKMESVVVGSQWIASRNVKIKPSRA